MAASGVEIRQSLHTMLTQAEIDLEMWTAMRKARSEADVVELLNRRYGRFYISAENAFFNSLVTILYAVFENRKDTINFWSLRKSFSEGVDIEFRNALDERYAEIKKTWRRIGIVRNEVVGHQTLKRTKAESHEFAGMTIGDLHEMVKSCQELLVLIAAKLHDTDIVFNLKGARAFENLISDLRANKLNNFAPSMPGATGMSGL